MITAIAFGVLLGIVIAPYFGALSITSFFPAITTLIGAYAGAKFAFNFQNDREEKKLRRQNLLAGNFAINGIGRMINQLLNYEQQMISPFRNDPVAFISMPATTKLRDESLRLNFESIDFLLDCSDPNILGEISTRELKFFAVIDSIDERSNLHRNEAQHRLEDSGLENGQSHSIKALKSMLGIRIHESLKNSTAQVIEGVDEALVQLRDTGEKLSEILKAEFPGQRVISLKNPDRGQEQNEEIT